jgi:hypothetical protein
MLIVVYAGSHFYCYAECRYSDSRYAWCRSATRQGTLTEREGSVRLISSYQLV